ncbi:MAG: mannitol dehydrogenase family protein [Vannielia sp.]|uniref:mannitol dehydrogenase family protein n=1 Tax=Vannielia sp. TaxID=2813045 RepID=UPI003B8BEEC1
MRLTGLDGLPDAVSRPDYTPADHGTGIVHLGLGAFHKAHQAAATDAALAAEGGNWRICGVSLRSPEPAAQLGPQNGFYTLIERSAEGSRARVIGSIAQALCLGPDRAEVLAALTAPTTRIVNLTVTEKGYGLSRATGGVDEAHPGIAHDLTAPEAPIGVAGLLVWALKARRAAGTPPFTVLCCDNLPENGHLVRGLLVDFARRTAPEQADFIASEVAFPSTMVDRITPAATPETLAAAEAMLGVRDEAAVETEAFTQWVIEDHFPTGRPSWEAAGAMFVTDVKPYEEMKLRMLNGAHSMLAYAGFLAGHRHVSDVMQDAPLAALVRRHLAAAAATLPPLAGVDLAAYAEALTVRFANPHLRHQTYQIAMDGTEKLPQRIFSPTEAAISKGHSIEPFAFAIAAWMRYAMGKTEAGETYALRDPREAELRQLVAAADDTATIVSNLMGLPGLFPTSLAACPDLHRSVTSKLETMRQNGMADAIGIESREYIS